MKRCGTVCLAIVLLFCCFVPARGSAGDPAITLSYINQKFLPQLVQNTKDMAKTAWQPAFDSLLKKMGARYAEALSQEDKAGIVNELANQYINEKVGGLRGGSTSRFTKFTLKKGDTLTGGIGTAFLLHTGGAQVSGPGGKAVVNISIGKELKVGAAVPVNQQLMVVDRDGTGIKITSDTATVSINGNYKLLPGYLPNYTDLANALYAMRLFLGSPTGYRLEAPATRLEALVMMIRLFGEEAEALAHSGASPFADVPDWGKPYVGYAYAKGYTDGTSASRFSPNASVTPNQYTTFLLRALGYSDKTGGDFSWDKALDFAVSRGVFSQAEANLVRAPFYRDQVVYLSYYTLFAKLKGSGTTLLNHLAAQKAVDMQKAQAAIAKIGRTRP